MAQPVYLPLVLLAAVVGMVVAFFAWVNRDRPGARYLTLFVVAASLWAVLDGLQVAVSGEARLRLLRQLTLTLSTIIPVAWLATVLSYTGRDRWFSRRLVGLVLLEPFVFSVLVWTSGPGGHDLVWVDSLQTVIGTTGYTVLTLDFGLAFWAHQVYTYLLVTAGALVLLSVILRTSDVYRNQGTALLVAIALPMIGNALFVFGLTPSGLDPTGLGFVLAGIVITAAILRQDLLTLAPLTRELGREEAFTGLDDRLYILDEDDNVVDANPAAEALVDRRRSEFLGAPVGDVLPELGPVLDTDGEPAEEVRLERDGHRVYDVRVSDINRAYGTVAGRLVSLRDVTERHQREERLDVLNRLLRHNLRNEMNVVRGNVSLTLDRVDDSVAVDRLERVIATVDTVIDRSNKVGTLSRTIEEPADQPVNVTLQIEEALEPIGLATPSATVETDLPDPCWVSAGPSLAVVWNELVTNAVEHADGPTTVRIGLDGAASNERNVVVTVSDDGPGLADQEWQAIVEGQETPLQHGSGIGLWMVNWVVRTYGGTVTFETETETGLTVRVTLPRADPPGTEGDERTAGGDERAGEPGKWTGESEGAAGPGVEGVGSRTDDDSPPGGETEAERENSPGGEDRPEADLDDD